MNKLNVVGCLLFFLFGLGLGWFLFHGKAKQVVVEDLLTKQDSVSSVWACPMHPDVRQYEPGKCSRCNMNLVPLTQLGEQSEVIDTIGVFMTPQAMELSDIHTSVVTRKNPEKEIRLYGKIQADDRLIHNQTANISGRIENLMVYSTGEFIRKGQTLALIYSPELVAAQQALLLAAQTKSTNSGVYLAAREKLYKWQLTDEQIDAIEKKDRIRTNTELVSSVSGVVTARRVNSGEYVAKGDVLYQISDISKVWAVFNAYENDLPFLNVGDQISFTLKTEPRANFTGKIMYMDPVLDPKTKISKVRVEMDNSSGIMRPDMFVSGLVQANVSEYRDKLIIPELAVLWSGKSSRVYVKVGKTSSDELIFKLREVQLGPMLGSSYVVMNGLNEGDEIVTQGAFNVETAAKNQREESKEE